MLESARELRRTCASLTRLSHLAEEAHEHGDRRALKAYARRFDRHVRRTYAATTRIKQTAGVPTKAGA